jgi:hypothetical protein
MSDDILEKKIGKEKYKVFVFFFISTEYNHVDIVLSRVTLHEMTFILQKKTT